jgi:FSR family fosmidomycin resistance protein-like MFS transporter
VPQAAQIAFINLFALAMGGLLGGILADKFGGKRILIATLLIYAPATYLLFSTQGITTLFIAPLAGFVAGASWPPLIVMAQDIFPKNAGVASGISLGFAFAMGGIGQSITGWLADNGLGLQNSLLMLSMLPVLAAVCVVALPSRDVNQRAQRAPSPLGASR